MPTRVTKLVCVLALMVTSQICAAETSLQRFDGFGGPVFLEVDKAFKMSSLTSEQERHRKVANSARVLFVQTSTFVHGQNRHG